MISGDEVEVKKGISSLFEKRTKKKVEMIFGRRKDHGRRVMKVERMRLYGSEAYELMESGAIPNVVSKTMQERLCVKPEEENRTITVNTGNK